jgi:sulfur carrier protein
MKRGTSPVPVRVNGAAREAASPALLDLLLDLGVEPERRSGVAVALNGAVVPRGRWAETALAPGDELEVIGAVQGG